MKHSIKAALIISAFISACPCFADDKGKSQTAASYLSIAPGIRSAAMGAAYCAVADDASAMYHNPAGIARLRRHEIMMSSTVMGLDRKHNFLAYLYSFEKERSLENKYWESWGSRERNDGLFRSPEERLMGFGIALINFGVDVIDSYDDYGTKLKPITDGENTIFLSYAMNIYEGIYFGLNLKGYLQTLSDASASGFGFDLGFLYSEPDNKLSLGLTAGNILGQLKWKVPDPITHVEYEYAENIQIRTTLGAAYKYSKRSLIAADIDYTVKQNPGWHIGHEFSLNKWTALRLGADNLNPTAGFGFNLFKSGFELSIDYAYVFDLDGLDNLSRFGLTSRFGKQD